MRTNLGKFLAKVRIDHNITQTELANAIGVSNVFINLVERGEKHLSFYRAKQLAVYLDKVSADIVEYQTLFIAEVLSRVLPDLNESILLALATAVQRESDWRKDISNNQPTTEECKQNETA